MRAYPRRLDYKPSGECSDCGAPVEQDPPLLLPYGEHRVRGQVITWCFVVCPRCFDAGAAVLEAQAEGMRFANIDTINRCKCGRPQLAVLGECVLCHRERRMLERRQAELNFNVRLVQRLRREARGDENRRAA